MKYTLKLLVFTALIFISVLHRIIAPATFRQLYFFKHILHGVRHLANVHIIQMGVYLCSRRVIGVPKQIHGDKGVNTGFIQHGCVVVPKVV